VPRQDQIQKPGQGHSGVAVPGHSWKPELLSSETLDLVPLTISSSAPNWKGATSISILLQVVLMHHILSRHGTPKQVEDPDVVLTLAGSPDPSLDLGSKSARVRVEIMAISLSQRSSSTTLGTLLAPTLSSIGL